MAKIQYLVCFISTYVNYVASSPSKEICPELRRPEHGSLVCEEWYKGKICRLQCDDTHDVAPVSFLTNTYLCANVTGKWNNRQVEDCSDRQYAVKANLSMYYYFTGNCSMMETEIQTDFQEAINESNACPRITNCSVEDVSVRCKEEQGKMWTSDDGLRKHFKYKSSTQSSQFISLTVSLPTAFNNESVSGYMKTFKLTLLVIARRIAMMSFNTTDRVVRSSRVRIRQPIYICPPGCRTGLFHRDTCVPCPVGSYHDHPQDVCVACPLGQYQGTKGQLYCDHCPQKQTTLTLGSVDISSCKEMCQPGNYSDTGVEPCLVCPRGTYQTKSRETRCTKCPRGRTTKFTGSVSEDQCNLCVDSSHYYNGMCYWLGRMKEGITWIEARKKCQRRGSTLTTIWDSNHEKFLASIMDAYPKLAYIGLLKNAERSPGRFKDIFHWLDNSPAAFQHWQSDEPNGATLEKCTVMYGTWGWNDIFCGAIETHQYICMGKPEGFKEKSHGYPVLPVSGTDFDFDMLENCSNGELVSKFKRCDGLRDCKDGTDETECDGPCDATQYHCNSRRCISLTFYCDGIDDCGDNSDESSCTMKHCQKQEFRCDNGQCINDSRRCDMLYDCLDNTDEMNCDGTCQGFQCYNGECIPRSWAGDGAVDCDGFREEDEIAVTESSTQKLPGCSRTPDGFGKAILRIPEDGNCSSHECPARYYKCPGSYCIPLYTVCNGVKDCIHGEDEVQCDKFTCPGYYRCQGENNCIDPTQFCDGFRHCPRGDDERYCKHVCPPSCRCHGAVVTCSQIQNTSDYFPLDVRKLDLTGTSLNGDLNLEGLHYLTMLILSWCRLEDVRNLLPHLPNLIYLDLSRNNIKHLDVVSFSSVTGLELLDLSSNIYLTTIDNETFSELTKLRILKLQNTNLINVPNNLFTGLKNLVILNLSSAGIQEIVDETFSGLSSLTHLDIRQNDIKQFGCCVFRDLNSLKLMYTDSYQLCCDSMRPRNLESDYCIYSESEISSCKNLLGADILRVMLWCIAVVALFGNLTVLAYRCRYDRQSLRRSFGVLVTNLSVADCLMGVYMMIIGSADAVYRDVYVSKDYGWRHSSVCRFAGFLSTVSTEASCIFISLITLDRFLAVKFPFGQLKFTPRSTTVSVIITWIVSIVLSSVPLLPSFTHWELFSKNSVCLALPLSSDTKPGWQYSTSIFVGFNFILFLLIGLGQMLIYREVYTSSRVRKGGSSSDAKVARKLFLVVFTNFLCWFPIGIMGIMALRGYSINEEVFAWTAVTVLPINSALNPIVYTVPGMIETWRESMRSKGTIKRHTSSTQGHRVPDNSALHDARVYVGIPTGDMVALHDLLLSRDLTFDVKCDLISLITTYLFDLNQNNRHFEPVTDRKIYVCLYNEGISSVCLSLDPDPFRDNVTEDVFYLNRLFRI